MRVEFEVVIENPSIFDGNILAKCKNFVCLPHIIIIIYEGDIERIK